MIKQKSILSFIKQSLQKRNFKNFSNTEKSNTDNLEVSEPASKNPEIQNTEVSKNEQKIETGKNTETKIFKDHETKFSHEKQTSRFFKPNKYEETFKKINKDYDNKETVIDVSESSRKQDNSFQKPKEKIPFFKNPNDQSQQTNSSKFDKPTNFSQTKNYEDIKNKKTQFSVPQKQVYQRFNESRNAETNEFQISSNISPKQISNIESKFSNSPSFVPKDKKTSSKFETHLRAFNDAVKYSVSENTTETLQHNNLPRSEKSISKTKDFDSIFLDLKSHNLYDSFSFQNWLKLIVSIPKQNKAQIIRVYDYFLSLKEENKGSLFFKESINLMIHVSALQLINCQIKGFDFSFLDLKLLWANRAKDLPFFHKSLKKTFSDYFDLKNTNDFLAIVQILVNNKSLLEASNLGFFEDGTLCFGSILEKIIVQNRILKSTDEKSAYIIDFAINNILNSIFEMKPFQIRKIFPSSFQFISFFFNYDSKSNEGQFLLNQNFLQTLSGYFNLLERDDQKNEFCNIFVLLTQNPGVLQFYKSDLLVSRSENLQFKEITQIINNSQFLNLPKKMEFKLDDQLSFEQAFESENIEPLFVLYCFSMVENQPIAFYLSQKNKLETSPSNLLTSHICFGLFKSILKEQIPRSSIDFSTHHPLLHAKLSDYDKLKLNQLTECLKGNFSPAKHFFLNNIFDKVLFKIVSLRLLAFCHVSLKDKFLKRHQKTLLKILKEMSTPDLLNLIRANSNQKEEIDNLSYLIGDELLVHFIENNELSKLNDKKLLEASKAISENQAFDLEAFEDRQKVSENMQNVIIDCFYNNQNKVAEMYSAIEQTETPEFGYLADKFAKQFNRNTDLLTTESTKEQLEAIHQREIEFLKEFTDKVDEEDFDVISEDIKRYLGESIMEFYANRQEHSDYVLGSKTVPAVLDVDVKDFIIHPELRKPFYDSRHYLTQEQKAKIAIYEGAMTNEFHEIAEDLALVFSEFEIFEMELMFNVFFKVTRSPIKDLSLKSSLARTESQLIGTKVAQDFVDFARFCKSDNRKTNVLEKLKGFLGFGNN